jgi:hypothetical protein
LPSEIGSDAGMAQSRRSIAARYRLEAYATLHPPSALDKPEHGKNER